MTALLLLLLLSPAVAYNDPWTDCNLWGPDIESIVLCRKAKMGRGQERWERQRIMQEELNQDKKQTRSRDK